MIPLGIADNCGSRRYAVLNQFTYRKPIFAMVDFGA